MWSSAEIEVTIDDDDFDPPTVLVRVTTPIGVVEIIGNLRPVGRDLYIDKAHVGGLAAGLLGRAGMNAIGRKLLEVADVAQLIVQGGVRTSGRGKGKIPRVVRFPAH